MRDERAAPPRRRTRLGQVCTAISAKTGEEMVSKALAAFGQGSDIVEFRVDHAREPVEDVARRIARFSGRAIVTVRRREEGGGFTGSEDERLLAISRLAELRPLYIDVELSTVKDEPAWYAGLPRGPRRIVSWHDFQGTPPSAVLERKRKEAAAAGEVVKIVTTSNGDSDNLRVVRLYRKEPRSLVAFCMGEKGVPTRLESLRLGSPVVYASLPDEAVAPGQLPVSTVAGMKRLWEGE